MRNYEDDEIDEILDRRERRDNRMARTRTPRYAVTLTTPGAEETCTTLMWPSLQPCGKPAIVKREKVGNGLRFVDCYCERHALGRKPA